MSTIKGIKSRQNSHSGSLILGLPPVVIRRRRFRSIRSTSGASSRERVPHRGTGPSISQAAAFHGGDGGGGGGGGGCGGSWRHERSRGTDI